MVLAYLPSVRSAEPLGARQPGPATLPSSAPDLVPVFSFISQGIYAGVSGTTSGLGLAAPASSRAGRPESARAEDLNEPERSPEQHRAGTAATAAARWLFTLRFMLLGRFALWHRHATEVSGMNSTGSTGMPVHVPTTIFAVIISTCSRSAAACWPDAGSVDPFAADAEECRQRDGAMLALSRRTRMRSRSSSPLRPLRQRPPRAGAGHRPAGQGDHERNMPAGEYDAGVVAPPATTAASARRRFPAAGTRSAPVSGHTAASPTGHHGPAGRSGDFTLGLPAGLGLPEGTGTATPEEAADRRDRSGTGDFRATLAIASTKPEVPELKQLANAMNATVTRLKTMFEE